MVETEHRSKLEQLNSIQQEQRFVQVTIVIIILSFKYHGVDTTTNSH